MRFSRSHNVSASTSTIFTITLLALISSVTANPYPRLISSNPTQENADILERGTCASPCGWEGQYCCSSDQTCVTLAGNIATCTAGAAVATGAAPGPAAVATVTVTVGGSQPTAATCNYNLQQVQCGTTCCSAGQFCNNGVCMSNGATTGGAAPPAVVTATVSAAIRPTSISTYTVFTTNGATSTVPFLMPATATASSGSGTYSESTSGSSLSGGAIAGIVIGVLAGIIILILIIICCCARGLLDLIRPKRKTEVTEIYEGHHHSGGAPPRRRFGLFGGGGGNQSNSGKKKSGFLGVAGILAALALVLGLKRRHDRKNDEKASTAYSYSEYTYDYSTSASSASSDDRRTQQTRSDRRSRR